MLPQEVRNFILLFVVKYKNMCDVNNDFLDISSALVALSNIWMKKNNLSTQSTSFSLIPQQILKCRITRIQDFERVGALENF